MNLGSIDSSLRNAPSASSRANSRWWRCLSSWKHTAYKKQYIIHLFSLFFIFNYQVYKTKLMAHKLINDHNHNCEQQSRAALWSSMIYMQLQTKDSGNRQKEINLWEFVLFGCTEKKWSQLAEALQDEREWHRMMEMKKKVRTTELPIRWLFTKH